MITLNNQSISNVNILNNENLHLPKLANKILLRYDKNKAHQPYSSHRERSHHCFYNGVGGLDQAIVPVWVQGLRQLTAFQAVLFRTRAHA